MANVCRVIQIKLSQLVQENVHMMTDLPTRRRPYLSAITVGNIYQSFTYKMAATII